MKDDPEEVVDEDGNVVEVELSKSKTCFRV
jgi:hypothetical protein